jgi:hypothetical protein
LTISLLLQCSHFRNRDNMHTEPPTFSTPTVFYTAQIFPGIFYLLVGIVICRHASGKGKKAG